MTLDYIYSGVLKHTSCNSFYKRTKISSLEIIIFELKNDGKKWSRIYFEMDRAPSKLLLPSAKKVCQERLNWPGMLAGTSEGAQRISK